MGMVSVHSPPLITFEEGSILRPDAHEFRTGVESSGEQAKDIYCRGRVARVTRTPLEVPQQATIENAKAAGVYKGGKQRLDRERIRE
jgi:hypothetical protein